VLSPLRREGPLTVYTIGNSLKDWTDISGAATATTDGIDPDYSQQSIKVYGGASADRHSVRDIAPNAGDGTWLHFLSETDGAGSGDAPLFEFWMPGFSYEAFRLANVDNGGDQLRCQQFVGDTDTNAGPVGGFSNLWDVGEEIHSRAGQGDVIIYADQAELSSGEWTTYTSGGNYYLFFYNTHYNLELYVTDWEEVGDPVQWYPGSSNQFDLNFKAGNILDIYVDKVLQTSTAITPWSFRQVGIHTGRQFGQAHFVSEYIHADEPTVGFRVAQLTVDGAGTTNEWTGAYTDVNASGDPDDSTFIESDAADEVQQFTLSDLSATAQGDTIEKLTITARALETDEAPNNLQIGVRTNSTDYFSANIGVLTGTFVDYEYELTTNPDTTSPWTPAEINSLELAVKSTT
jgi:hypothetical protein